LMKPRRSRAGDGGISVCIGFEVVEALDHARVNGSAADGRASRGFPDEIDPANGEG